MRSLKKKLTVICLVLTLPVLSAELKLPHDTPQARVTYYARYNLDRARLTLQYRSLTLDISPANLDPFLSRGRQDSLNPHVSAQNLRFGYWAVWKATPRVSLQAGGYSSFSLTGQWHRPFIKLSLNGEHFFTALKGAVDFTEVYNSAAKYQTPRLEGTLGFSGKHLRISATAQGLINLEKGAEGRRYPFDGKRFSHEERLNLNLLGAPLEPYAQLAFLLAAKTPSAREWRLALGFFYRY